MSVNLYSASPPYGLFNILGKLFKAQADINTSRGTTIPTDVLNTLTFFQTITSNTNLNNAFQNAPSTTPQYQSGAAGAVGNNQSIAQQFLIAMVGNDKVQPDSSLKTALQYIITQMIGASQSVNVSTVGITVTPAGGNTGNGVLLSSTKRGDGLVQENTIAETFAGTFGSSGLTANLSLKGQSAASSPLGQDWPEGSGNSVSVGSVDANSSSMVTNGGMETWANQTNVPDSWIAKVATPSTTILQTVLEVQQIVIASSPTGTFTLSWVNYSGKTEITAPIAFSGVSASTIQSALRQISGLGSVTVALISGTSPNITVQVTFAGAGGAPNLLTAVSNPSGASITITRITTGTSQVFAGSYSCQVKGNGSELTEIWNLIPQSQLAPNTAYGISLWACCDASIAAGVVKVELFDGSAIINDTQGNANAISFNATALTTSFQHLNALQASECVFRTPAVLPPLVYLRIRLTTALTNAKSMFVDNVGMTPMTQAYSGGPFFSLFAGNTPWASADTISVVTTNNRAGVLREWCNRNFQMDQLNLLFPSSGSPTIPDSVVS